MTEVDYTFENGIARIGLTRLPVNAITLSLLAELIAALCSLQATISAFVRSCSRAMSPVAFLRVPSRQ